MIWERARVSRSDGRKILRLNGARVPRVDKYKYGDVLLSSRGGWSPELEFMRSKSVRKTRALIGWARRDQLTADIVARITHMHVERVVLYGVTFMLLSATGLAVLDAIQRKASRMILGFSSRSPHHVALSELGWAPWSAHITVEY